MKHTFIGALALSCLSQFCSADSPQKRIERLFDGRPVQISEYNAQLKEVTVEGQSYFATHDGRYVLAGPIIDTQTGKNIVAARQQEQRLALLATLPENLFLQYSSKTQEKHKVTVFTDIDCPFCRRMHEHMKAFNDKGISVDYVMLPRAGVDSPSFDKTVSALCADNPKQAMDLAMQGNELPKTTCRHTLNEQLQLAQKLGISSTPATILPNGRIQTGLMSPEQLLKLLQRI